jgi:hypothetical protein
LRIRATLLLLTLISALFVAGCATTGTTPTGYQCTFPPSQVNQTHDCYYFIDDGKAVPCQMSRTNLCDNTAGDYYDYSSYFGHTYLCEDHIACMESKMVSVPKLCSPKYAYDHLTSGGQAWRVVNEQEDQNSSQESISTSFSSTSATTVSTSLSAQITANVDALLGIVFASVHAEINGSVAKTVSTVVGNQVAVTIPAGRTAYGIYGVKMQVTSGDLYQANSCGGGKPDYGEVQTYVPIASGWCVWLSGGTPCPVISDT